MEAQRGNTLSSMLDSLGIADTPVPQLEIRGVEHDSRRVSPGDLFVAIDGLTVDGHHYAAQAVAAGAVAVVCERPITWSTAPPPVPCILVRDSTEALGLLSSAIHGQPTQTLSLYGITGTNGKSTTAYLLRSMLTAAGKTAGLIGTIEYSDGSQSVPAPYTTPSAPQLQSWLARMVAAGSTHAVMEVSSHGLQLGRTWGCAFDVAAFSNLTQDHLDFHGDMESYLQAKLLLFRRHLDTGGTAVINLDGAGSEAVVRCAHERGDLRVLGCSRASQAAPVRLCDLTEEITGLSGTLIFPSDERVTFRSKLVGSFNADNILLAAGCAYAGDIPAQAIAAGVDRLSGVPGRLERVPSDPDRSVFVDYAHTPDALARALDVLRPLCSGRLIVVFGCGGDRDRAKRPRMGEAAAERADLVLVTSDNPRSEDPHDILAQIVPGVAHRLPRLTSEALDKRGVRGYLTEPDRASAIDTAVGLLGSGDVLLIAGKGHENYQLIGAQRLDFDDRQQARVALARHHEAGRVRPPRRSR